MDADRRRFGQRAGVVLGAFILGFGLVGARAVQLQVYRHAELAKLALGQYLDDVQIPARRGHIYDRNGKALAISVEVPSVFANPMMIEDPRRAARQLSELLDVSVDSLYQRLASERMFVWLKRQVSPEVAARVRGLGLPGVATTQESRRFYPNRELGAHLVGFTGVDVKGLEGIEKSMDAALAGEPQVVATLRDARGNSVLSGDLDPNHRAAGADVFVTIDLQIQHAAEVTLRRAVADTSAAAGIAVVLDVPTAEVLAVAIEPHFNPNKASVADPSHRRNRAFTDVFEPGSTLKPMVIAAGLDAGVITADTKIFCENGAYTVSNHTIRDGHAYGWLDLTGIIKRSSNIGAAKCGQALGKKRLHDYLASFGFGRRTEVRFPGESSGILRAHTTWSDLGVATISFGQGVAVSALQLAGAFRALAAGGLYRAPTLVRKVEYPDGRRGRIREPADVRVVSAKAASQVIRMMEAAVDSDGTAWRAAVPGYRVAGKTGTAQKIDKVAGGYSSDEFVAVFGGFLPAEAPRVVIIVAVDEPHGQHTGGAIAAPIFAEIGEAAMRQLGVIPSTSVVSAALLRARGEAERREQREAESGIVDEPVPLKPKAAAPGTMPDFTGLTSRQVMERYVALGLGLDLEMQGSGCVIEQEPPPGARGDEAGTLRLVMAVP